MPYSCVPRIHIVFFVYERHTNLALDRPGFPGKCLREMDGRRVSGWVVPGSRWTALESTWMRWSGL